MYQRVIHFIKYHNAFTIIFVMVFFGFGLSYAASPAVRESVYSSTETVVSVDNGLIVSADLDDFSFNLRINSITEDETNYYAVYSYQTLVIENDVWQNQQMEKTFKVSKETLNGKDLGLYVAEELGENIEAEKYYLKRVQKLEKEKGESRKVVSVEYSGLIGKLLNPKEKVIDGYNPVIPEVVVVEETPTPELVASPLISDTAVEASTGVPSSTPVPSANANGGATGQAPEPTATPEPTLTPTTEATPTSSPVVSESPVPSPSTTSETTPTPTPEATPTPTPDVSLSPTPTPSDTPTPTPESTPTPTPEPTPTPTPDATPSSTPEPTPTPTPTS